MPSVGPITGCLPKYILYSVFDMQVYKVIIRLIIPLMDI